MPQQTQFSFLIIPFVIISFLAVGIFGKVDMLGPVDIEITYVGDCENPEMYPMKIFLQRTKYNRTHDTFDLRGNFDFDIDDTFGLHINVWKWGDGGYKPNYITMEDKRLCQFFMRWQETEFKKVLRYVGRQAKCPIGDGVFAIEQYPFLMTPLQAMVYGNFKVVITFNKGDKIVSCVEAKAITKPKNMFG